MLFLLPLALIALFAVIVLALQRLDERDSKSFHDGGLVPPGTDLVDWRDEIPAHYLTPLGKKRLGIDK